MNEEDMIRKFSEIAVDHLVKSFEAEIIGADFASGGFLGKPPEQPLLGEVPNEFTVPLGRMAYTSCNPPGVGKALTIDVMCDALRSARVTIPKDPLMDMKCVVEPGRRPISPMSVDLDYRMPNLLSGMMKPREQTFMGLKVVTSPLLTETVEDWSDCRSPARARRRLKHGFPQRVKYREVPDKRVHQIGDTVVMHPDTWQRLRFEAANRDHRLLLMSLSV